MKFEKHIDVNHADETVVDAIATSTELSRQAIKQAMNKGAVWVTSKEGTRRIRRADRKLKLNDTIHLYYDESVLQQLPIAAQLIADESVYSIWFKPYGMLSQGSKWGDHCTINRWSEQHLVPQRPAFIVHRLDRAASGLMVIAHTKKAATQLARLFEQRMVHKVYRAIVHGRFPDTLSIESTIDNKQAVSHATSIQYDSNQDRSLLDISIETGRKHQIRRHLSEAGFPIVGDRLYGNAKNGSDADLQLVSCLLEFISPFNGETKTYRLPDKLMPFIQQS